MKVFGSTWTAYPAPGEPPLEAGERVCVESVEGASIYVKTDRWRTRLAPKQLTDRLTRINRSGFNLICVICRLT